MIFSRRTFVQQVAVAPMAVGAAPRAAIVTAPAVSPVVLNAARDLQSYLSRLFGVHSEISSGDSPRASHRFIVGEASDPHVAAIAPLPALSRQGHLVKRVRPSTVVLAGGSAAAAAWAVYELAERYGVRYLLHGDVLPEKPGAFHIPDVDAVFEPAQQIRSWRQFNVLPFGPMMWRLTEQKAFLNQLHKLKFNGVLLNIWQQHPLVDYAIEGIRKQSWGMLFETPIPVGDDNIGREGLWPGMKKLTNPEFLGVETFDEALAVGRRLFGGILDHAQSLGMHTAVGIQPFSFPVEFRGLLQRPTAPVTELSIKVCAETAELNNPKHLRAFDTTFRAYVEQWGRVDALVLGIPEHPHADRTYRAAWRNLAAKHGLNADISPDEIVERTKRNALTAGGVQRGEREIKSNITMIQFLDEYLSGSGMMDLLRQRKIDLYLGVGNSSEELLPYLDKLLPQGCGITTALDYTASRGVRRLRLFERLDASKVPAILVTTLQDDNIGWVPQVATESLHLLLQAMHRSGWSGFMTRYWPIGDLDPPAAYLARASWNTKVAPRDVYLDHFTHVYGKDSAELLVQAMRLLEDATVILDLDFLSLLFPVPNTTWARQANRPMAEGLFHILAQYRSVRVLFERIEKLPGPEARRANLAYWISRVHFAISALDEIRILHEARMALETGAAAVKYGNSAEAKAHTDRARSLYAEAAAAGETALRAAAAHIRDDSDRGAVAAYYHFMVREVKRNAAQVLPADE